MFTRVLKLAPAAVLSFAVVLSPAAAQTESAKDVAQADGVIRVKSAYPLDETIARLKKDIADKGIRFFLEVDQTKLAADAGITVRPSTLLIFGNAPLGTRFLTARPQAGLDWPVRLLVQQDEHGNVWALYTDFIWIARRHSVDEGDEQPFKTASEVIASIASSIRAR